MNNELMELNKLVDQFNEGCKPLIDWMSEHKNDPFFDTQDGRDIRHDIAQISTGAGLLNLKIAILLTQDLILERLIGKMNDED